MPSPRPHSDCQADAVEKPTSKRATQGSKSGLQWSLPHSITKHREDVDKGGQTCIVYDVVFNPQALRLASMDPRFKDVRSNRTTPCVFGCACVCVCVLCLCLPLSIPFPSFPSFPSFHLSPLACLCFCQFGYNVHCLMQTVPQPRHADGHCHSPGWN